MSDAKGYFVKDGAIKYGTETDYVEVVRADNINASSVVGELGRAMRYGRNKAFRDLRALIGAADE